MWRLNPHGHESFLRMGSYLIGDLLNAAVGIEPRALVGVPIVALVLGYLFSRRVRGFFEVTPRKAA